GVVRVDEDALGALAEAFKTAERVVQLERDVERARREARAAERRAREVERLVKKAVKQLRPPDVEKTAKLAEEHASLVKTLSQTVAGVEEALARGEWGWRIGWPWRLLSCTAWPGLWRRRLWGGPP
ncbi:hypothetical protein, partial [Pyrobaculum sp.]|uniref:hypothetical protein n=1 Tax=Pyrobaculum sp. TaxID=2004705 RepID=UPI003D144407